MLTNKLMAFELNVSSQWHERIHEIEVLQKVTRTEHIIEYIFLNENSFPSSKLSRSSGTAIRSKSLVGYPCTASTPFYAK